MNAASERTRLAIVALALILSWAVGYGTAIKLRDKSHRQRVAAITAERDRALADLADSRKRHQIARRSIERFSEELAHVDKENEELRASVKTVVGTATKLANELCRVVDVNVGLQQEVEFLQLFAPF
jgi:chromosome segregation ATPase